MTHHLHLQNHLQNPVPVLLPVLLPVDISGMDAADDIEYSEDEAVELLKSSSIFDQFITDAMNDFEQFSKKKAEDNVKN